LQKQTGLSIINRIKQLTIQNMIQIDNRTSPFHKGERAIQSQLGVRDRMENFGNRVIRDYLPEQHRDFYTKLSYIIVGHADNNGHPWASILFKKNGLIQSSDEQHLTINSKPLIGDPLSNTLINQSQTGGHINFGLLGIELESRRRNRLSAYVTSYSDNNIQLKIKQTFGNCPKYIQAREMTYNERTQPSIVKNFSNLDNQTSQLITKSDTFFIASYLKSKSNDINKGADVSHRGGKPGFVTVHKNTLTIPDYQGNNHFNTLGNILENPVAGLTFIDFDSGDIIMLTGKAQIIWDSKELADYNGAQRLLKFTLVKGISISNAVPLKWGKAEMSRFL